MNGYPYGDQKNLFYENPELSRGDLIVLGLVLSFFTAVLAGGLSQTNGLGDLLFKVVITVVVGVAALASFRGALLWGSASGRTKEAVSGVSRPDRAYELDIFNHQHKAA